MSQKRETERLCGCDQYMKNRINYAQYIYTDTLQSTEVYRHIIRKDTFILDHQSRPYFYFNKTFDQDDLKYKTQNPAVLFTKESIENAEF